MLLFSNKYDESEDLSLLKQAKEGSRQALEKLVKNHQRFIYNIALKFVHDQDEAADLAQDVLIIMVTKLTQFKGNSSFRTWLYRIVANHFIKSKKRKSELQVSSFEQYGEFLDQAYNSEEMTDEEHIKYNDMIIDTRNRCMAGMLLCLNKEQRMVFILGAIFKIKSASASRILNITAENFRQQLSRAKADLFQFMENKCGLVNPANPCRCSKKTKGFIQEGKVDFRDRKFTTQTIQEMHNVSPQANHLLDQLIEGKYLQFFMEQPYEHSDAGNRLLDSLLLDREIKNLFRLN
ncbi:RNA polymerase sigma factor [Rhodocytophaga aerolata]|uniref:RNA polymerase sigma factor n=1 Tax=Rhodocytophaga aerolata TaxID=455078 RepID=A0ABT8RAT1_9BACT|nr:RNA polymerase sigma factor [Rhodocytophaga aerolata]MDO1449204.1 RNA polymerase sigma factor [Rhodocytophaga aerolata]